MSNAEISAAVGVSVSDANVTSQVERVAVVKLRATVVDASPALAGGIDSRARRARSQQRMR